MEEGEASAHSGRVTEEVPNSWMKAGWVVCGAEEATNLPPSASLWYWVVVVVGLKGLNWYIGAKSQRNKTLETLGSLRWLV